MVEKKKFWDIELPITNTKVQIVAAEIEKLENRTVKVDLTRMLRGESMDAVFRIRVKNEQPTADLFKLELQQFFIRRMMRKSASYVEDSFQIECKDAYLKIKPFMITRKKVIRAVRNELRNNTKKYIEDYAKDKTKDEVFTDILKSQLQKTVSLKLKKTQPLAFFAIRRAEKTGDKEGIKVEKIKVEKQVEKIKEEKPVKTRKKTEKKTEETEEPEKEE